MEHEPDGSPSGVEPADDDDESRGAAGLIAGTTAAAAFGGTVAGGIAASSGGEAAAASATGAASAAPASPPVVVHGSPAAGSVHGSPSAPVHGSPPPNVHVPTNPQASPTGAGGHGLPVSPTGAGGHGLPLIEPSTPPGSGRGKGWQMVVAGAVVAVVVVVGALLLTGGDDDKNDAANPSVAEPNTPTTATQSQTAATTANTAPVSAGPAATAVVRGLVTFVATGGLEQSGELRLMSTAPTDGGMLFNFANDVGDQVLQVGALEGQTIISLTTPAGIVAGASDEGCVIELTYDGNVLKGGTFECVGIPGVAGGANPITADVSGTFDTGS